jgi:hypothetical protein
MVRALRFENFRKTADVFLAGVALFLRVSPAGETWGGTNWKCWGSTHMAFMVLVLSVLPLFTGLSFIVVATFFDRDPSSKNIEAKVAFFPCSRMPVACFSDCVLVAVPWTCCCGNVGRQSRPHSHVHPHGRRQRCNPCHCFLDWRLHLV